MSFEPDEAHARALDAADPLASFRERFHLPADAGGRPLAYLCGHSLGAAPRGAAGRVAEALSAWARLGVEGHFQGTSPWYDYHRSVREGLAAIVGARPSEVVAMNSLTVNLHLMMVSFYRPTAARHRIVMEACAFPSDTYAVRSQLAFHGHDPDAGMLLVADDDELEALLARRGEEIALVLLGAVNYYTGRLFDLARVARAARAAGCTLGLDLAHAAGNVPLALHDWGVDFAAWCSYKYLNSGPGAVAGCFVHERHAAGTDRPRFAGWWGNDPATRFRMHLERTFVPVAGAEGWQLSNPPIFSLAPLGESLALFAEAGPARLGEKSAHLTGYLQAWIDHAGGAAVETLTPRAARGCQVSLRARERAPELARQLAEAGVAVDRRDDVVRAAPVPLYNSFHDVWRFGQALTAWARSRSG